MRSTLLVYCAALCLLLGSASIAPPLDEHYNFSDFGYGDVCAHLVQKLPCEEAGGAWQHVCKASVSVSCNGLVHMVEMSRQLPDHVAAIVVSPMHQSGGGASLWGVEQQAIVRPLGVSLGLGLLTLGRQLYNPCLFYLPAILVGCTAIQPLSPYLVKDLGLPAYATEVIGALVGIILASLQRHLVVWLMGMLMGVLAFIALYVSTTYLNDTPVQLLLPVGIAFGLAGSSIMLKLERTHLWKVLACALVGSVLLTDALGVRRLSVVLQYMTCLVLVLFSCYQQVSASRRKARLEQERLRVLQEELERKQRAKDKEKRRRTVGVDGRDRKQSQSLGSGLMSLLSPRKRTPAPEVSERVLEDSDDDDVGEGEREGDGEAPRVSLSGRAARYTAGAIWTVTLLPFKLVGRVLLGAPKGAKEKAA